VPLPGAEALDTDAGGGRACRVCKVRGDHSANTCPLHTVLGRAGDAAPETDVQRWVACVEEPVRQVLLSVQQLASAQLAVHPGRKKRILVTRSSLTPQHLRDIETALRETLLPALKV
jgi:hypothetical protein